MLRLKQRARTTERAYLSWLRQFYSFSKALSPTKLDSTHVKSFLTQIVVERNISRSSQNQAFNALLFFYRHVLEKDLDNISDVVRSRKRKNLPVVLTKEEVSRLLDHMSGIYLLMAQIIYGGGLRLRECVNLRIKDIDFDRNSISIIAGKGNKDRQTLLSETVKDELKNHVKTIYPIFQKDQKNNIPGVELPNA
jgi:site-specific recombinase XerD